MRVNGLCPGIVVETGFWAGRPVPASMPRPFAPPEVIVPAAVFLASDESAEVTGQLYYGRWFNEQIALTGKAPRQGI